MSDRATPPSGLQTSAKQTIPRAGKVPRLPPIIDVDEGDLEAVAIEAWLAIEQANQLPTLFRYANGLAQIETDASGMPFIRPLDENRFRHRLTRVACWRKHDKEGQLTKAARPPDDLARDMLARADPPVPALVGLTSGPYVAANGTICLGPGYHVDSRLYYVTHKPLGPIAIPPTPTAGDVAEATQVILDLLADFPFVSPSECAHAMALLFAPFVEQLIDGPLPAHAIDKPVPGAGAGLLTDVLLWPSLGHAASKMTEGGDEEEWRKRITAKLVQGAPVIVIDNVRHRLDSAALASALTEAFVEERILGHTRMARIPARRIWVFTGNNLQMSDEIRRRTVRIRLDPGIERPELRTEFRHPDLRGWVAAHRAKVVTAILTICQAYLIAGRPEGKRSLGSFEAWAQVIGGLLDVAGIPGFLDNLDDVRLTADPQELAWKDLFTLWWDTFQSREVGVSELWSLLRTNPDALSSLNLGDGREDALKARLGLRLGSRRDRVFDGRRLENPRSVQGANRWRLVPV